MRPVRTKPGRRGAAASKRLSAELRSSERDRTVQAAQPVIPASREIPARCRAAASRPRPPGGPAERRGRPLPAAARAASGAAPLGVLRSRPPDTPLPRGLALRGGGGVSRSAGGEARPRSAAGVESGERGGEGGRRAPSPWRPQRQSTVAMSFQVRLAVGTDRLRDAGGEGGASRPPSPCAPWGPAAAPARRTPAPGPGCRGPVVMAWFGRASPARGPAGKGAGWCVKPGEELRPRDCALRMQRSWQRPRRRVGLYFSPSCTWTLLIIQTFWG